MICTHVLMKFYLSTKLSPHSQLSHSGKEKEPYIKQKCDTAEKVGGVRYIIVYYSGSALSVDQCIYIYICSIQPLFSITLHVYIYIAIECCK